MANPFADYPTIVRHLETRLLVADLKDLLKGLHLSTSGNKRPLIDRVAAHLSLLRSSNDVARYTSLKNKILRCGSSNLPSVPASRPMNGIRTTFSGSPNNGAGASLPYNQFAGGNNYNGNIRPAASAPVPVRQQQVLNFRPSPFYEIVERISAVATLPYASRNTVTLAFVPSLTTLDRIQEHNATHKIALMCAESTYAFNPNRQLLMEFPNPTEVRVNNTKLQSNLRGMKNKPGTIPPPDITPLVSKVPRLQNRVDITYTCPAENSKKYGAQVVLLKMHTVAELVERVKNGVRFSKDRVLEKLRKPDDDDIEMASFDLTLKDPLSYMRITVPCRSLGCKHNQCFDAAAFLQINEQTPQWTCPICHIEISGLSSIAIDSYFQDILDNVGQDVDTILVDPQGNWRPPSEDDSSKNDQTTQAKQAQDKNYEVLDLDDTEDEEPNGKKSGERPEHLKAESLSRGSTPVLSNGQNKRKPAPICIDLTEDSDEEIASPKRMKQSHSMDNSASFPSFSPKTLASGQTGPSILNPSLQQQRSDSGAYHVSVTNASNGNGASEPLLNPLTDHSQRPLPWDEEPLLDLPSQRSQWLAPWDDEPLDSNNELTKSYNDPNATFRSPHRPRRNVVHSPDISDTSRHQADMGWTPSGNRDTSVHVEEEDIQKDRARSDGERDPSLISMPLPACMPEALSTGTQAGENSDLAAANLEDGTAATNHLDKQLLPASDQQSEALPTNDHRQPQATEQDQPLDLPVVAWPNVSSETSPAGNYYNNDFSDTSYSDHAYSDQEDFF